MNHYYSKDIKDVLNEFQTSENGLNRTLIESYREKYGYNQLLEEKKASHIIIFLQQFKDLLVIILLIAAVISASIGNIESTIVILAVILLNALLGTVQHIKAEQSLKSLKSLSSPIAKVIRDGTNMEIPSREVVPGDILIMEAGDFVAADGRIIKSYSIQINESSLTGESENVYKISDILHGENIALGDQNNMVFSGSLVTYGRALVVATGTGMNTEIGKIATLMKNTKEKKTPLQIGLDKFGQKLAVAILIICVMILALSIYRGSSFIDSLMFAVALAVAAIPEALSSIVTIVLAIGTEKMAKENAIIKKLKSVESLGSVSVICSDKTGTLTQNKMTVKKLYVNGDVVDGDNLDLNNPIQLNLLTNSILCNDSTVESGNEIGDPTEIALVNLGKKYSFNEINIRNTYKRFSELPFDSSRKLMSTAHEIHGKYYMITKGALDVLLPKVNFININGLVKKLTDTDRDSINNTNRQFSESGLRVLAFGYKEMNDANALTLEDENNYTFLGLISMIDPPRVESKKAVMDCISAGIKPIMITGDHKITASAIAKEIGILQQNDKAVEGVELDSYSDEDLIKIVDNISVYARVSPEHKIRIVKAWQEKGNIVAMTGDGVNDAPALKQSDIGIAMGITGTEVSKDAASMILTDDNFATIVKAIAYGRNIYSNIKNSIRFLLSGNTAGILAVVYASLAALPIPFAAVHLLFINLLTDSLPAIAIGMENPKSDLLKQKPREADAPILSARFLKGILSEGVIIAIFTMISFHIGLNSGDAKIASTMAFATLCLGRLFHGFNCRGEKSLFKIGVFSNRFSWMAFGTGFLLLNLVLILSPLKTLFSVSTLNGTQFAYIYGLAFMPTVLIQFYKIIFKK